jgi:hypothetical protein
MRRKQQTLAGTCGKCRRKSTPNGAVLGAETKAQYGWEGSDDFAPLVLPLRPQDAQEK